MMKVYLAHPCFNEKQKKFKIKFLNMINTALTHSEHSRNIAIIDPFDYTPNIEGDTETKLKMAEKIKTGCIKLLEECDILAALVDDNDTGTAFEAGYAHSISKPVILISKNSCSAANAMLIGAAEMMIDNILEEGQIEKLLRCLERFNAAISKCF
jgi:nucleoside 2-deoxyribosyltransferase